ncbi:MAG TPA: hypothetical protein VGF20_13740 [Candidatus Acidoferrum sp.]
MSIFKEEWIAELASEDDGARRHGASQIFAAGRARAFPIVRGWLANEELRRLLSDEPAVTVGLAVRPETFAKIREANGWPRLTEVPPEQDASEFELLFADRVALDVLTSREPEGDGAIAKFLVKFGEGVQQVELRCSDVGRATGILREAFGIAAVYPETRPGADGTRVNFFLVAGADGRRVLIELYEASEIRF